MRPDGYTYNSRSPEQTCHLARALSARLRPGDVLLLSGEIGAGKTHFARCLILASLASPEDVPSPTYTLVQTYQGLQCELWHADLYRLSDTAEIEELGLTDAYAEAITIIEWPDRLGDDLPASALRISFSPGDKEVARTIRFDWTDTRWDFMAKGGVHA